MKQGPLPIVMAVLGAALLVGAAIVFSGTQHRGDDVRDGRTPVPQPPRIAAEGSSTIESGVQYIDITASEGYSPSLTHARADTATVIRIRTDNTYDCSSALVIPALNYQAYLKPTGVVDIPVPEDKTHGTLEGLCSMGMYRFEISFQ
jgi:hypothetical protein